jgi:hypothetical protein
LITENAEKSGVVGKASLAVTLAERTAELGL